MKIENLDERFVFVRESEVGRFLPWIAAQDYMGAINLSSFGTVSYREIIAYIEKKVKIKATIDNVMGENVPFRGGTYSLNLDKIKELGYCISELDEWFWGLMDEYIARAVNEKKEQLKKEIKGGQTTGQNSGNINCVDKLKCTGCGACDNRCPKNAITMIADEKGFLTPVVDDDKCISCQLCIKVLQGMQ
jgi:ferredoxin